MYGQAKRNESNVISDTDKARNVNWQPSKISHLQFEQFRENGKICHQDKAGQAKQQRCDKNGVDTTVS